MERNPIMVVREAEKEAKELVEAARQEKRDARAIAEKEAEDRFHMIMQETDDTIKALKDEAYGKADALTVPINQKAAEDARIITAMTDEDLEEAVGLILERMKN